MALFGSYGVGRAGESGGPLPMILSDFSLAGASDGVEIRYKVLDGDLSDMSNVRSLRTEPKGVIIVRSETGYPETPDQGVLVIDDRDLYEENYQSKEKMYKDVGLSTGKTYYYSAFPYTHTGLFDYSPRRYPSTGKLYHRAVITWTGASATLSVNVQAPSGYQGIVGDYTITLLDQAETSPQNIEKSFSGTGVKKISGITTGKTYKVKLGDTSDLKGNTSEAITFAEATDYQVTMTYNQRYGTINVNVSLSPSNMPEKFIPSTFNVQIVPQDGGEAITKSATGAGIIAFNNAEHGVQYKVKVLPSEYYPEVESADTITGVGGGNVSTSITFEASHDLETYSWQDIQTLAFERVAKTLFPLGAKKKVSCKYITGDFTVDPPQVEMREMTTNALLVSNYVNTNSGDEVKDKFLAFLTEDACGSAKLRKNTLEQSSERFGLFAYRPPFNAYMRENGPVMFPDVEPYAYRLSMTWAEVDNSPSVGNYYTQLNNGLHGGNGEIKDLKFYPPSSAMIGSLAVEADFQQTPFDTPEQCWRQYKMYAGLPVDPPGSVYNFDFPYMTTNERRKLNINGQYATCDIVYANGEAPKLLCVPADGGTTAVKADVESEQQFPLFFIIGKKEDA